MSKEPRLSNPCCGHCQALPMNTGVQIIPGPNGMTFANIFCASCGVSMGLTFLGIVQPDVPRIVKPS